MPKTSCYSRGSGGGGLKLVFSPELAKKKNKIDCNFFMKKVLTIVFLSLFCYLGCSSSNELLCLANLKSGLLNDVSVVVDDTVIWSGSLEPSFIKTISFKPKKDGSISIKWPGNRKNFVEQRVGYVTPNKRQRHSISILEGDTLLHENDNLNTCREKVGSLPK